MPTLLLLPGWTARGELFDAFVAARPSTIDVVTVRYPGHEPLGHAELPSRPAVDRTATAPRRTCRNPLNRHYRTDCPAANGMSRNSLRPGA